MMNYDCTIVEYMIYLLFIGSSFVTMAVLLFDPYGKCMIGCKENMNRDYYLACDVICKELIYKTIQP
jgi:hypothetical protein